MAAAVVPKGVLPPQPGAGSRQALNTQMLIADIAEELTAEEPNDAAANTGSPNVTQAMPAATPFPTRTMAMPAADPSSTASHASLPGQRPLWL